MGIELSVSQIGLDIHRKFSRVTARDCDGKVAWRRRRKHTSGSELGQPDDAIVVARP